MANSTQNSPLLNDTNKGRNFRTQAKTIFRFLWEYTATASMVTESTGVPQKNICRYKRDYEKAGMLWEVKKDTCKITGYKAWYLTTNPEKAPSLDVSQLKLF